MKIAQMISKLNRGHSDLNQGPAGLQPDALPLSYIPLLILDVTIIVTNKVVVELKTADEWLKLYYRYEHETIGDQ